MSKHLVLVSHGLFCEELKKSTEMIMGPQENIHAVSLLPEEGPDDFRQKLEAVVEGLENVVVFADLLGGTPANVVSRMMLEGKKFDFYVGMNMPMVIGFLNGVLLDQDVDIVEFGTTNIQHVNDVLFSDDDDEDE
ncbi:MULTISPECIES: PTS sugar transporter subunit IIA [Streptococcus]|uniref:PTS sugar transporter subunit IIA n=1 Tax=Streptococcus zalophi TaxID=640031 RepID=A0A934PAA2_9STRE|nr:MULTISPECIES: PTS sugar transporter subunit IIA [Streptococcus]MBJ8349838.1 PTS sugar transporter subunit IIA [Streptococcus zalophi]MCR8967606.1 PTS sugar transporter subunit IIA [Streptococcus zalophi]MCU9533425.1 PTS sugar transporter subunit IIA [Streptococcus sp. CSL10205-OR2]